MAKTAAVLGVACSLAALSSAGNASAPGQTASITSSSDHAGAHPVALILRLHYEMQCGSPGRGTVILQLPAQMTVPATIARSSVLVNGKTAPTLARSGSKILVGLPSSQGAVMCDVIAPGTLTIGLTRSAGIGNPDAAGTYVLRAARGPLTFQAQVRIR